MPMIGFLPIPAGEDPLAGFPSDGLSALYKCDEREGDRLKDATGNLPDMVLATGVALDCAAADCLFDDTTGLHTAVADQPAIGVMACEIITPAAAGSANDNYIIARAAATNSAAMSLNLSEITTTGKFRIYAIVRTIRDATTTADTSFNSSSALQLEPSTHYQVVVRVDMSTSPPSATFSIRSGVSGAWSTIKTTGGTAGTHLFVGNVGFRLLAYSTGSNPWNGKIMSAFCGAVDVDIATLRTLLNRPTKTYIRNVLGTTLARFWDFRDGTGATSRELCTDTVETISGTVAWSTGLSGCTQPALRQGQPYYGRAGVKIGGEPGYVPTGGGAVSAASPSMILSHETGWSFQMTGFVGNRDPASATQLLAYVFGPDSTGAAITDPGKQVGAGFVLDTSQNIAARAKRVGATDVSNAISTVIGGGSNVAGNGLLTTYTLTCSFDGSNWVVNGYRQAIGESAPTEITPAAGWSGNDFNITRANAVRIGNASLDCEAVVGFVAIWDRPITESEMAQCHNSAIARMSGQDIYVAAATSQYGNGSENYPYSVLLPAMRTSQPGQDIYIGAGEYGYYSDTSVVRAPSSVVRLSFYGASRDTVTIIGGAGVATTYPLSVTLAESILTFSGITFDAAGYHSYAGFIDDTAGPVQFLGCAFTGGKANTPAVGSGCLNRADGTIFADVISYSNEEHGIYNRISDPASDGFTVSFQDVYCYDNTEDGIKFSSEGGAGASWRNVVLDRIRIDGGNNQIWLAGVADSVVSNIILENQAGVGTLAALYFGYASSTNGEDVTTNVAVANVTIYNAALAVLDNYSTGVTVRNLVAVDCTKDFTQGANGSAELTYCAGNSGHATELIPTDATNIPDATLALVDPANATVALRDFNLDTGSDGIGVGANLYGLSQYLQADYGGTARSATGAWNMGAF